MYGKVKRLRDRGVRLSDHDIGRAHPVEGEVSLAGLGTTLVLEVRDPNSQVSQSLFPKLYDARLISMHGSKMLFKGEERPQGDAGPAFIQEWAVVVAPR
jgi:hypothetical protein